MKVSKVGSFMISEIIPEIIDKKFLSHHLQQSHQAASAVAAAAANSNLNFFELVNKTKRKQELLKLKIFG